MPQPPAAAPKESPEPQPPRSLSSCARAADTAAEGNAGSDRGFRGTSEPGLCLLQGDSCCPAFPLLQAANPRPAVAMQCRWGVSPNQRGEFGMTASPAPSHPQHPPEQPHPIPPVPCCRLTSPGRCGAARPALYTSWHAAASLGCEKKGAGRLRLALRPGSPGAGFIASAAGPPPAPPVPSRRSWPRPPRALVFSSGGSRGGNVCARGEAG